MTRCATMRFCAFVLLGFFACLILPSAQAAQLVLPGHIPANCVESAGQTYDVPVLVLLAVMRQESGGRSVVRHNTNGTVDIGPAQVNSGAWAGYLARHYGIESGDLMQMCQALRVEAFILRKVSNEYCGGRVLWCGVGYYHSSNPKLRKDYVEAVYNQYLRMMRKGRF